MKLLNRLRELRLDNHVIPFDYVHFSMDHYHDDHIGIGATVYDDIVRLNIEKCNLQKDSSKNS